MHGTPVVLVSSGQNSDTADGLSDLYFLYGTDFLRSVDIHHVTLTFDRTGIIFTKFELAIYPFVTYNVFTADTLRHAVTLTYDAMTFNMFSVRLSRDQTQYQI